MHALIALGSDVILKLWKARPENKPNLSLSTDQELNDIFFILLSNIAKI